MAPQSDIIASLPVTTSKVFDQVQSSTANHQKNCVALSKLHVEAAKLTEDTSSRRGGGVVLVGEKAFEDVFISMVMHVLPVKKGVTVADRVVKFVGSYVKVISERGWPTLHYEDKFDSQLYSQGRVNRRHSCGRR